MIRPGQRVRIVADWSCFDGRTGLLVRVTRQGERADYFVELDGDRGLAPMRFGASELAVEAVEATA